LYIWGIQAIVIFFISPTLIFHESALTIILSFIL
jgi:hypothetical protein